MADYVIIFSPVNTNQLVWDSNASFPDSRFLKINFYDKSSELSPYLEFRMSFTKEFENVESNVEWLLPAGDNINGNIIEIGSPDTVVKLDFINLDKLMNGGHKFRFEIILEGYNVETKEWSTLAAEIFTYYLHVDGEGYQIKTDKKHYLCYYNKVTNTLFGDKKIIILNNEGKKSLNFENDGTFVNTTGFTDEFDLEINDPLSLLGDEKNINSFLRVDNKRVSSFTIKLVVVSSDVMVNPGTLAFTVRKSQQEIKSNSINVFNPLNKNFSLQCPSWLVLSQYNGNSSLDFEVKNINPTNLNVANYEGDIKLLYDNKVLLLPVKMEVISFYSSNFDEKYNFCLDDKILNIFKMSENAVYVRVTMTVKLNIDGIIESISTPLVVPYFKEKCTIKVGEKINRYFIRNTTNILAESPTPGELDNKVHLHPAMVDFKIEELDINYNVVYAEDIYNKRFYPGKKPDSFPFLTNFNLRSRRYDSSLVLSYISGLVDSGSLLDTQVVVNDLDPYCIARFKVESSENKINFGDKTVITSSNVELEFLKLDDGPTLIEIQWENQNLSPECISFTGEFSKPTEKTQIIQTSVFTGRIEKFSTTNQKKFNINTGFILRSEEDLIDELVDSNFCIVKKGEKFFNAYCISSKIIKEDSARNLIEFDLEFQISE